MKHSDYTVKLSGKLYNFRSLSSLNLPIINPIPFKSNVVFYRKFDRLHDTISNIGITYNNVVVDNGFYFDSSKSSYMYFKNPQIQQPYSIVVTFKAISGARRFIIQYKNTSSIVSMIRFNQNGSIEFNIGNSESNTYNNVNVFDGKNHNIVLQIGSDYYKFTVDKDTQNSVIVNRYINLSDAMWYVLGHNNYGFNGYIYKFAIYNKTFTQPQLNKVLDWL